MTEIIKIKNAYVEIEIHATDLILRTMAADGGNKKLYPGIEIILEDLKKKFETLEKIN